MGGDNGDVHRLLLEKWHAQGLAQHLAQLVLGEGDGFLALAAAQIGVDHVALDGAWPDDGDLDHQIIIIAGAQAGQHGHLGAAFDLENAHRVGAADHVIGGLVPIRQGREGFPALVVQRQKVEGLADAGQHAQREDVDLEHPQGFQIVLIPFDDGAVLHRRVLDRDQGRQPVAGNDKAAHMLGEVAGETDDLLRQIQHLFQMLVGGVQACAHRVLFAHFG